MTPRLLIRPQADRDIDEIAEHIFEDDPAAGLRFLDNVYETMKKLASMPSLGSPCEFSSRAFAKKQGQPGCHRPPNRPERLHAVADGLDDDRQAEYN